MCVRARGCVRVCARARARVPADVVHAAAAAALCPPSRFSPLLCTPPAQGQCRPHPHADNSSRGGLNDLFDVDGEENTDETGVTTMVQVHPQHAAAEPQEPTTHLPERGGITTNSRAGADAGGLASARARCMPAASARCQPPAAPARCQPPLASTAASRSLIARVAAATALPSSSCVVRAGAAARHSRR